MWFALILTTAMTCYAIGPFQFQELCENAIETAKQQIDDEADWRVAKGTCEKTKSSSEQFSQSKITVGKCEKLLD